MCPATYSRKLDHARRDVTELFLIVCGVPDDILSTTQLAQAIGLASTACDALQQALAARAMEEN